MADYAKMDRELFRATTKAIEILQQAQIDTEELFLSAEEPLIRLMPPELDEENKKKEDRGYDRSRSSFLRLKSAGSSG